MVGDVVPNPGFLSGIDIEVGVDPYKFLGLLGTENPHGAIGPTELILSVIDALCGRGLELRDKLGVDTFIPYWLCEDGAEVCATGGLEGLSFPFVLRSNFVGRRR